MKSWRHVDTMARDKAKRLPCVVCARFETDPHHIISRGAGGNDFDYNLMPLCRICHTGIHKAGIVTFADKHPQIKTWLLDKGWTFYEFRKKWMHP